MKTPLNGLRSVWALLLWMSLATICLADESQGKFKNALADKETFVVTVKEKDHTFHLGANAKVFVNDRESVLSDLKAGDSVTVTWQPRDDRKIASKITCKRE
jgi:hypothetical protein